MPYLSKASLKQKLFAKQYVETLGNKQKASLGVYNVKSKRNANSIAYQNLQKPLVQQEIKHLLQKKGLDPDYLSDNLKDAIENNLKYGKASQAVGADLLKFTYKLWDLIPSNKNLNLNYSRKEIISKDYDEVKKELSKLSEMTKKLLSDTP